MSLESNYQTYCESCKQAGIPPVSIEMFAQSCEQSPEDIKEEAQEMMRSVGARVTEINKKLAKVMRSTYEEAFAAIEMGCDVDTALAKAKQACRQMISFTQGANHLFNHMSEHFKECKITVDSIKFFEYAGKIVDDSGKLSEKFAPSSNPPLKLVSRVPRGEDVKEGW